MTLYFHCDYSGCRCKVKPKPAHWMSNAARLPDGWTNKENTLLTNVGIRADDKQFCPKHSVLKGSNA